MDVTRTLHGRYTDVTRTLQGRYRTLQDVTGRYRTLQDVTRRYWTLYTRYIAAAMIWTCSTKQGPAFFRKKERLRHDHSGNKA